MSWTMKKAELLGDDAFELWKKGLFRVSDQYEIKSVNPKENEP